MKNKKPGFRTLEIKSGTKIFLGKDAESNDELLKTYKGKENIILHTIAPGSPFGVIENLNPSKEEINLSGAVVARYSQDWRDNKKDIELNVFSGKNISKKFWMKKGTWNVKNANKIKVKKKDILGFMNKQKEI